jgi:hypothetical protein
LFTDLSRLGVRPADSVLDQILDVGHHSNSVLAQLAKNGI